MNDYTRNAQEKTYYVPEGFTAVGGNGGTGEKADIFNPNVIRASVGTLQARKVRII